MLFFQRFETISQCKNNYYLRADELLMNWQYVKVKCHVLDMVSITHCEFNGLGKLGGMIKVNI